MSAVHPMVLKAARAWCKRHAEACGLDEETLWAEREAGFLVEAQAALDACWALELLALAEQYANECASCGGTTRIWTRTQDPQDSIDVECPDCIDIWLVIEKAGGLP